MRTREYYKSQTKKDPTTQRNLCFQKKVKDDPQIVLDLYEIKRSLDDDFREWDLERGIHWLLGFEAYVKEKKIGFKSKYLDYTFRRGTILMVDFFGHFGKELTYEHPAVVLYDDGHCVLVAPISSPCYQDGIETHVNIEKRKKDQANMPNNCGIKLEQIRYVSKSRIIEQFQYITNRDILAEIDIKLMALLSPFTVNELLNDKDLMLTTMIDQEQTINTQKQKIDHLEKRIQLLEQELGGSIQPDEDAS
ncbi:type II toxin-antitoxin system PemK/MazF family toxin [Fictibacillus sp. NRS-1165]|uniref:type II toxin-antitoxin system PemK/MazF family toxin n=1 Tax=Fictibacillus sp. NRS-1165 TaxID=3144463 RepID=UPI003D1E04D9